MTSDETSLIMQVMKHHVEVKKIDGIKIARDKKGLTQADLAMLVKVERSTIAKWETKGKYPRCEMLPKLAKALGCTIEELFYE